MAAWQNCRTRAVGTLIAGADLKARFLERGEEQHEVARKSHHFDIAGSFDVAIEIGASRGLHRWA
jgi:hypothetical protein